MAESRSTDRVSPRDEVAEPQGLPETTPYVPNPGADGELPAIPGYEILKVLGRGGMGVVYQARQTALKRLVALKMILSGGQAGEAERNRFRAEAESVARLRHPNIVQIHEVGEHAGRPFFTLECVEGGSLSRRLAGEPQPPQVAAALVETLARAVQYAHEQGVIHRDLKPANVLLSSADPHNSDPGTPHCELKITDFGLAKQLDSDSGQTQTGAVMGTPSYMAPEQAAGRTQEVGPLVDVYALGAILYEMLTGRPPFKGATVLDTLDQVRTQEPVPPSRLQPRVPRDLETICLKCLQKDSRRRYVSALELAEDLQRYLAGRPILARPVGATVRILKWARRRPTQAALVTVSVVAAVALLIVWALFTRELNISREEAVQETEKARTAEGLAKASAKTADEERIKANQERRRAENRELESRYAVYPLLLNQAVQAWNRGDVASARRILASLQPQPGQEDLRGFEWFYYWRLCHQERKVLAGYPGAVRGLACSPDGQRVIVLGQERRDAKLFSLVIVRDVATGKETGRIELGECNPVRLFWHRDGSLVVGTRTQKQVSFLHVLDVTGLRERLRLPVGSSLSDVALCEERRLVAATTVKGVQLWQLSEDLSLAKELRTLPYPANVRYSRLAFASDGSSLAAGASNGSVAIWDPATGQPKPAPPAQKTEVGTLAFAPGNNELAIAYFEFGIRLWDCTKQVFRKQIKSSDRLNCLAFSPDGKLLAGAGGVFYSPSKVTLWNVGDGKELTTLRGHTDQVWALAFLRDGKSLVSAADDSTVRFWDIAAALDPVAQGRLQEHPRAAIHGLAFDPKGDILATAGEDATIRLWNISTVDNLPRLTPQATLTGHADHVIDLSFSPDGSKLASASRDQTVHVWDLASGKVRMTLAHPAWVSAVTFSPDGKQIATGTTRNLRIWDADSGKEMFSLTAHAGQVRSICYSRDGTALATGGYDRLVKVWRLPLGSREANPIRSFGPFPKNISRVAFSPDGKQLAASCWDGLARLFDLTSRRQVRTLDTKGGINSLNYSPDGRSVLFGGHRGESGTLHCWNLADDRPRVSQEFKGILGSNIYATALSPDGRIAAAGTEEGTLLLTQPETGKLLAHLPGHARRPLDLAISPDGQRLAIGCADFSVALVNARTGAVQHRLDGFGDIVTSVALSPDGRLLAAGSFDQTIRLWNLSTPQPRLRATLTECQAPVRALVFAPDGKTLASGEGRAQRDGVIRLWDLTSASGTIAAARALRNNHWPVRSLAFSPDGQTLAAVGGSVASSRQGDAHLWDIRTGKELASIDGIRGRLKDVTFSPDGSLLAFGGFDNVVTLWDPARRTEHLTLKHEDPVMALAWPRAGRTLATSTNKGAITLWDARTGQSYATLAAATSPWARLAFDSDGLSLYGVGTPGLRVWPAARAENADLPSLSPLDSFDSLKSKDNPLKVDRIRFRLALDLAGLKRAGTEADRFAIRIRQLEEKANGPNLSSFDLACAYQSWARLSVQAKRWDDAQRAGRRAVDLLMDLIRAEPANRVYRRAFFDAWTTFGGAMNRSVSNFAGFTEVVRSVVQFEEEMVRRHPQDPVCRQELREILSSLGSHLLEQRDFEGEDIHKQALDVADQLVKDFPNVPSYRVNLAHALTWLAASASYERSVPGKSKQDRWVEAEEYLDRALRILESLRVELPPGPVERSQMATLFFTRAALFENKNRLEDAIDHHRITIQLYEQLASEHPESDPLQVNLGKCLYNLGRALSRAKRYDEAESIFRKAIAIEEPLAKYRHRIAERNSLAMSHNNLGHIHFQREQFAEAEAEFRKVIAMYEAIMADDPLTTSWSRELATVQMNLALALSKQQRSDEAVASFNRAAELVEKVLSSRPNDSVVRGELQKIYDKWRSVFKDHVQERIAPARRRKDLWQRIVTARPDATEYRRELAKAWQALGLACLADREAEAVQSLRAAVAHDATNLAMLQELAFVLADPNDPSLRKPDEALRLSQKAVELGPKSSVSWFILAIARHRQGDYPGTLQAFQKSDELRKTPPAGIECFFLAMTNQKLNRPEEARSWLERGIRWAEKSPADLRLRRLRAEAESRPR